MKNNLTHCLSLMTLLVTAVACDDTSPRSPGMPVAPSADATTCHAKGNEFDKVNKLCVPCTSLKKYSESSQACVDMSKDEICALTSQVVDPNGGCKKSGDDTGRPTKPDAPTTDTNANTPTDPAKPPVTDPAKPPVTDPAKPPVTDPAKPPVTDPAKPPVTDPALPPVTDPALPPVTDPALPPVVDPAKPPVTDPAKPAVTDPAKPAVSDPAKPPVTDAAKPAVTDPVKPLIAATSTNVLVALSRTAIVTKETGKKNCFLKTDEKLELVADEAKVFDNTDKTIKVTLSAALKTKCGFEKGTIVKSHFKKGAAK